MKKALNTNLAPQAEHMLSQAIISNGFIFVAGQVHVTPEGQLISGSVAERMDQIMHNISQILEAGHETLDAIVKVTIFLTNMNELKEINAVYPTYFSKPYPAREAICVKELPLGAQIEISVVAEVSHEEK